ncbi:MAG: ABC-F family ATP-binding cassette domain-containing protein [Anaerolineae bacterium]|nr:ABC-F family ATP-binding cassette domain-containing protein [Anaerolineales bacterium]MCQ3974142.1 ABC transporter ATP-binding protein [Anaerolineae bacterium]
MISLRLDNVAFSHPGGLVLENLSWAVPDTAKVGLVGPNGAGKSTVLKLLAGHLTPENGFVVGAKGDSIGYLPQEVKLDPAKTVLAEALTASPKLAAIEAELQEVETALSDPAVYGDESALAKTLEQQSRLLAAYEEAGGLSYENTVKATLRRLGFSESDFTLLTSVLSGGQKKLLALAKLAVNQPAVLLLDEPDNHLDLAGKVYLEKFIRAYPGAVVIVSHDRYLLDEVAEGIVELAGGKLDFYTGNYSAYVTEKELRRLRQAQLYAAQQKEIARLEAAIARFELWASLVVNERHIKQARNKRRQIERMDKVDQPLEQKSLDLRRLNGWRGSDKVLEIVDLVKAFGDDLVLAGVTLRLWHGERVGLIGPNGAGKSVLFRCITGEEAPTAGVIKIGPSVKMGVYTQEHQSLAYEKNLVETVRQVKAMYEDEAVAFLGKFLFPYQQAKSQTVGSLSGGERSRLQIALLMLQQPNFLLLDEPTNNLDIQAAEALEQALDEFNGTVLVISHDRYFLDKVVDRVVELDPNQGALVEYLGGYTDYLAARLSIS